MAKQLKSKFEEVLDLLFKLGFSLVKISTFLSEHTLHNWSHHEQL